MEASTGATASGIMAMAPIAQGLTGSETSSIFPISSQNIASGLSRDHTLPQVSPQLAEKLKNESLKMHMLRDGGRGSTFSIIA